MRSALVSLVFTVSLLGAMPPSFADGDTFGDGVAAYHLQQWDRARTLFLKYANEGSVDAQYRLAQMYDMARGGPRDAREAHRWYLSAADGGHGQAQHTVANMYAIGDGVPHDVEKSFIWFERAARNNQPRAQYHLGNLYLDGEIRGQDLAQALYWFSRAANTFGESYEKDRAVDAVRRLSDALPDDMVADVRRRLAD